jgi:hypothetical protein
MRRKHPSNRCNVIDVDPVAVKKLSEDIETGTFRTYEVQELPAVIFPEGLHEKMLRYTVAASGNAQGDCQWLLVMGDRLDHGEKEGEQGIDKVPLLVVLNSTNATYPSTAMLFQHADFPGARVSIPIDQTVQSIAEAIVATTSGASENSPIVLDAMRASIRLYDANITRNAPRGPYHSKQPAKAPPNRLGTFGAWFSRAFGKR